MSIQLGAAHEVELSSRLLFLVPAVSLLIAWRSGLFSRHSILGPRRLAAGESPFRLLAILMIALGAMLLAVQICVSMMLARAGATTAPGSTPQISDNDNVILEVVQSGVAGLGVLVSAALLRKKPWHRMGLTRGAILPAIFIALMALIVAFPLIIATGELTDSVLHHFKLVHDTEHPLLKFMADDQPPWMRVLSIGSAIALAPLAEELVFRGMLQTMLRYWTRRPWLSVIITAAVFAAIHPWWSSPSIFVLALALGYIYERTGNLWASIFLHAMFNATEIYLFLHLTQ